MPTQARALCQQVGETPELIPVLFGLWRFYLVRSQFQTVRELGRPCCAWRNAHDPALAVIAHYARGWTWCCLGVLPAARQHLDEGAASRQTSAERRCSAWATIRVLPAEPLPR